MPSETQMQNSRGEWVPSIPLPYFLAIKKRCGCGRAFWTMEGYRAHYALAHILHVAPSPSRANSNRVMAKENMVNPFGATSDGRPSDVSRDQPTPKSEAGAEAIGGGSPVPGVQQEGGADGCPSRPREHDSTMPMVPGSSVHVDNLTGYVAALTAENEILRRAERDHFTLREELRIACETGMRLNLPVGQIVARIRDSLGADAARFAIRDRESRAALPSSRETSDGR